MPLPKSSPPYLKKNLSPERSIYSDNQENLVNLFRKYAPYPCSLNVEAYTAYSTDKELPVVIRKLKEEMRQAAKALEFEKAAVLRDRIRDLSKLMLEMGGGG